MKLWIDDQEWERRWWNGATNTLGEELKQLVYAKRMGLTTFHDGKSPFNFDLKGALVLDIGGGPCSLLLKCVNVVGVVADPCDYPTWVMARYEAAGLLYVSAKGEELEEEGNVAALTPFDECWLYNVLQHTEDPDRVIANARKIGKIIRLFEWIDTGTAPGHPHNLTETWLNEQLGGFGKVEEMNENTATGKAFFGVFKGEQYGI